MASARHFRKAQPTEQTRAEIEADITNSRRAQRDLQAAGSHGMAERLRQDTDECLDELADLDAGRWKPKHA
ncbi:hypothetical protein CP967_08570 [Streptomyces nitrosporeus]|uniref:Uncharacterized protein n=1 Tax=Streptomyces nitrosporeus TaxID=28894 RepID=A0A5J6FAE4_9ACTN|nr:hypothetical protein [Streptomyces nitrosporeus]QEU72015.1 hypothetical protein CP967_08570 [Streptomyces nitrosporeus]GGY81257.1 hypothetical protein GCM10010327_09870 [Streptomyces nitrosporeus]